MDGHFVKGGVKKPTLKAKHPQDKDLDIILPTSLDSKYDVEQLDTAGLPTSYNGYKITWANNFKLKAKPDAQIKSTKVDFEVQFDKPAVANLHLFMYDGSGIVMIGSADADTSGAKVAIRLHAVDPAVGWGN
jgi:hypothetical protein